MAIAQVSGNGWGSVTPAVATPGVSVGKAYPNNVTGGSLLVAVVECITNDPVTLADSVNGAWAATTSIYHSGVGALLSVSYFANSGAGATTVTATGTASQNKAIWLCEYSGASTASVVDGTPVSAQASSSSAMDPGAITTVGGGILIGASIYSDSYTVDPTGATNYTNISTGAVTGGYRMNVVERITTGAMSANHPAWSTSKSFWMAVGIAFKESAGGGGGSYTLMGQACL